MISSRNLVNALLALAVVALALIVVFEPGKAPPPPAEWLMSLSPADIRRIEIQGAGEPVVMERRDGQWQLQGFEGVSVGSGKLDILLSLPRAASTARYAVASMDLKQAGLDQPELNVIVDDTRVSFGATEPINGRRYVRVGDQVHLIDDRYSYLLRGEAASFVDSALLPADARLDAIRLPQFTLRQEDGHWELQDRGDMSASADELQRFADEWRYARALRVSAAASVEGDAIELQLRERKEPLRFTVTKLDGDTVLTREDLGLRYHFTAAAADKLLQLPGQAK